MVHVFDLLKFVYFQNVSVLQKPKGIDSIQLNSTQDQQMFPEYGALLLSLMFIGLSSGKPECLSFGHVVILPVLITRPLLRIDQLHLPNRAK